MHWHAQSRSFLFDGLEAGWYAYRAWGSAERVCTGRLKLAAGSHRCSIKLPEPSARSGLQIPVGDRLVDWQRRVHEASSGSQRAFAARGHMRAEGAGSILCDLIEDGTVIASITQPLEQLSVGPRMWDYIKAYTRSGQGTTILASRARYLIMTFWIGLNPGARARMAPDATDEQIWSAVLSVVATLDDPDLDDVFLWGSRLHRPVTAVFEQFARSWADRFNGVSNLRTRTRLGALALVNGSIVAPEVPERPAPVLERSMQDLCGPVLADVAHVMQAVRVQS